MIVLRREQTRPCRLASVMAVMHHDKHRLFLSMPVSKHFLDTQTLSTPLEHCNPSTHLSEVMSGSLLRVDSFYGDQRLVGPRVSLSTFVPEDAAFHVETKGWRQLEMICEGELMQTYRDCRWNREKEEELWSAFHLVRKRYEPTEPILERD